MDIKERMCFLVTSTSAQSVHDVSSHKNTY
jgi:hypothetical protein